MNTWMELQRTEEKGQEIQERQHLPHFLPWPISQPGPCATPPLPGYVPVPTRAEQVMLGAYVLVEKIFESTV